MTDTKPAGGAATPPITMADLKEGDAITIAAVVSQAFVDIRGRELVRVEIPGAGWGWSLPIETIATHTPKPKPLAPGDRAFTTTPGAIRPEYSSRFSVEIIAIEGPLAWVKIADGRILSDSFLTPTENLERAQ